MNEDEARAWFAARYPADAIERLDRFVTLLRTEGERQSLIARSTFDDIWSRHLLDSAQLETFSAPSGPWLDVGSGGGLPGLVLAVLNPCPITLVEPRRLRVAFLRDVANALGLRNVTVAPCRVQQAVGRFAVVTARAVAPVSDLLTWTTHLVSRETLYLLPRGRSAHDELENATRKWHGAFHVEQSISSADSGIIVATGVRPR